MALFVVFVRLFYESDARVLEFPCKSGNNGMLRTLTLLRFLEFSDCYLTLLYFSNVMHERSFP